MDISLLSTFLCRCVSVIHRMSSEWCSSSAIMSSIFPRSALTFKVPINISSGVSQSHLLPISAGDLLHVYLVSVLALLALWNCFLAYIRLVFPWVHRSYSFWRNLIIHAVTLVAQRMVNVDLFTLFVGFLITLLIYIGLTTWFRYRSGWRIVSPNGPVGAVLAKRSWWRFDPFEDLQGKEPTLTL